VPRWTTYVPLAVAGALALTAVQGEASAAQPRLPGFQPTSASFLSSTEGFVLGTPGCPPGRACRPRLVATTDAGAHWHALPALPAGTAGSSVLFATPRVGWLYGKGIWVTRDGGVRWRKLAFRGSVTTMAVSTGPAYAIAAPSGSDAWVLLSSPVTRNAWQPVPGIPGTAESSLAARRKAAWFGSGNAVWATTDGTHWHKYPFACTGKDYGLAAIAAASPNRVRFLCTDTADFNTASEGIEIMTSATGGRTERLGGREAPVIGDGGVIAVPPRHAEVTEFATSVGAPAWISRTQDDGRNWRRALTVRGGSWTSMCFINAVVGWVVDVREQLLRTTDAGRSWHSIRI
jgi:hypothetical protein